MKNILYNNENIVRAMEICRTGGFKMAILFNDDVSQQFRSELIVFCGQFVQITPVKNADLVVEYFKPEDIRNVVERDYSYLLGWTRQKYQNVEPILNSTCEILLNTAYNRLGYDLTDVEIIKNVASCIAYMGKSDKILVEHVAEAIHYRAFDRSLLNDGTANEFSDILAMANWQDSNFGRRFTYDFENAPKSIQSEMEGYMSGWQDAIQQIKDYINSTQQETPPNSDWYICYVDGERMPLCYNQPNKFWVGLDGKTYSPSQIKWINK